MLAKYCVRTAHATRKSPRMHPPALPVAQSRDRAHPAPDTCRKPRAAEPARSLFTSSRSPHRSRQGTPSTHPSGSSGVGAVIGCPTLTGPRPCRHEIVSENAPVANLLAGRNYQSITFTIMQPETDRIRMLNDTFRTWQHVLGVPVTQGDVVMTQSVASLGAAFVNRVVEAVRAYDDFSPVDDPYGEHDFGSFELDGEQILWKIDLYEKTVVKGSAVNGSLSRCNIPHVPLGSADTPRRHKNSRRSNRPSWASFAARISCRRIYTGMHRLASFLWPDCRTVGT